MALPAKPVKVLLAGLLSLAAAATAAADGERGRVDWPYPFFGTLVSDSGGDFVKLTLTCPVHNYTVDIDWHDEAIEGCARVTALYEASPEYVRAYREAVRELRAKPTPAWVTHERWRGGGPQARHKIRVWIAQRVRAAVSSARPSLEGDSLLGRISDDALDRIPDDALSRAREQFQERIAAERGQRHQSSLEMFSYCEGSVEISVNRHSSFFDTLQTLLDKEAIGEAAAGSFSARFGDALETAGRKARRHQAQGGSVDSEFLRRWLAPIVAEIDEFAESTDQATGQVNEQQPEGGEE